MASTYKSCVEAVSPSGLLEDAYKMLQCITITSDENRKMTSIGVNQFFLIYTASLVFLMQAFCKEHMEATVGRMDLLFPDEGDGNNVVAQ
eukprot:10556853-Ditylum_brightwellii.AAC.1